MRNSDFGGPNYLPPENGPLNYGHVLPACPLLCARLEVGLMSGMN